MSFNTEMENIDVACKPTGSNYIDVNNDSEDLFEDSHEEIDNNDSCMDISNNETTNTEDYKVSSNSDETSSCGQRN